MDIELPAAFEFLWADKADDGYPVRYRAAHGGRAAAKSHSFCEALILKGAERKLRIGCYREVQKSIRDSAKRLLDDKIAATPSLRGFYSTTDTEIRGANDTLFIFGGLRTNPDAIKSTEGLDIGVVFEANRVSQRSWDLLIPTIRAPGSEIWAEWNPESPTDPVDALFRGENGPPPRSIVREVSYRDNPWFPDELRVEMEWDRKRDFDKYQWIWEGKYLSSAERRVFKNWRVDDFEAPPDAVFRFGADWGFAVDPTVLIRCYLVGRTLYIDHEAYLVGCEIDVTPQLFDSVPGSRKYLITADSARPETVSYMQRQGFRIAPAIKGAGSVEDGVEFLRSFDIVVHSRCRHLIDELSLYSYKADPLTGAVLPVLEDRHNHCVPASTLVKTHRGDVPVESVRSGDYALTRKGFRRITFAGVTDTNRRLVEVRTSLGSLKCTPDHEIWTARGFVRADALRYGDEVTGAAPWSRSSSGWGAHIAAILRAKTLAIATISAEWERAARSPFTERSGSIISAKFQKARTSTIGMATRAITTSPIWSAFRSPTTWRAIPGTMSAGSVRAPILAGFDPSQRLGTPAMRAAKFTRASVGSRMKALSQNGSAANAAVSRSKPEKWGIPIGSAPTRASRLTVAQAVSITRNALARFAVERLSSIDTNARKPVLGHVLTVAAAEIAPRVYDLTVDGEHEFFGDGILVSNCIDAARYALEGARRAAADMKPKTRLITRPPIPAGAGWMRR